jgi:TatD DNase family protein
LVTPAPRLVDSHCHLAFTAFDADRPEVVQRAREAGIASCVVVSVDGPSARRALEISERWPGWAHPTAGLHPTEPAVLEERNFDEVLELLDSGRFHAVGESGLDAYHDRSTLPSQVRSLHRHVRAALDRSLPVILHCRDAFDRLTAELAAYRGTPLHGVLHCYTGTARDLPALLEAGLHIGVGGIATFKGRDDLRAAVRDVPLERLLLETDAPWLAPQPVRGRRNEPAFVAHVAEGLARDRGVPLAELAAATTANANALFRLGLATPPRPA